MSIEIKNENLQKFEKNDEDIDLFDLRKKMHDEMSLFVDEMWEAGVDTKEIISKKREFLENFVEKLKTMKEKFKFIFETENGSIYFVSKNGKSWRFKKEEGEDYFSDQPILNKIIFISPEEREKYLEIQNTPLFQELLVGYSFQKSDISKGFFPLEIGAQGFREVVFEETEKTLKIIGTKINDEVEPIFASGIHLGHSISNIFKE